MSCTKKVLEKTKILDHISFWFFSKTDNNFSHLSASIFFGYPFCQIQNHLSIQRIFPSAVFQFLMGCAISDHDVQKEAVVALWYPQLVIFYLPFSTNFQTVPQDN